MLFHFQGTPRTTALIEHCNRKTPTGIIIQFCIDDLVLDTDLHGTLWNILFEEYSTYVVTHSRVYHTCEYNHTCEIKINMDYKGLKPYWIGYQSVMSLALKFFSSNTDLRAINRIK